ncbi:conserved hypothetical protein [Neospora caninum Liverpool]|uniref:Uncharacterized protein n=1 Tax=Neospora caninum (strain Liverpool) TaxID=572307 RepID=F0VQC6_NEOCL|nr:conserved hypothetical protein [Neospora caninum Liverpool]CBZ55923.1 conserved hypothetical protein [Neospora caninum Liverpool]CEL70666.1 TPA: hypothetical protein BN1204_063490 [Neospora caninum Liverpool]|eukprot:XP_003885949.1 conserved hypothetical protein [Neospora caninum Liverpool]
MAPPLAEQDCLPRGSGRGCLSGDSEATPSPQFSLENPHLLTAVCQVLKRIDKQGTGLTTAERFNAALSDMGVKYGTPEADMIMRYCQVTDDGYVIFKELMLATRPFPNVFEDHITESLASATNREQDRLVPLPRLASCQRDVARDGDDSLGVDSEQMGDDDHGVYTPELTDAIRRLYAQWDRSCLRDWQFKEAIQRLGVCVTPEFERLISTYGPSGSVAFSQVMQTLMMGDSGFLASCSLRRSRSRHPGDIPLPPVADRIPFYEPRRNPVTWSPPQPLRGVPVNPQDVRHLALNLPLAAGLQGRSSSERGAAATDGEDASSLPEKFHFLKKLVALYLADRLSATQLRKELVEVDVPITQELDALIRAHEADNSGQFTPFAVAVFRAAEESEIYRKEMRKVSAGADAEAHAARETPYVVVDKLTQVGELAHRVAETIPTQIDEGDIEASAQELREAGVKYPSETEMYTRETASKFEDDPKGIYVPSDYGAAQHATLALANRATAHHAYYGHGNIITWGKTY